MSDGAIIYVAILIGFVLLVLAIKFFPFVKSKKEKHVLMYYKLDLQSREITTITYAGLNEETQKLSEFSHELIFLSDVEAFINSKAKLPEKSFLISLNETYSHSLKQALPVLVEENISLIIFLPILISSNRNKYQQKEVQQLNDFIFSEEFKNIFGYTQPNCRTSTTIK